MAGPGVVLIISMIRKMSELLGSNMNNNDRARIIRRLESEADLPLPTTQETRWDLAFPKLEFNLPSGGYCIQDTNPPVVEREYYPLDIPMIEEIRRQSVGTVLENHMRSYSGTTKAMGSYTLVVNRIVSFHKIVKDTSDEIFLGELLCLFLDETIMRVGRIVRIIELTCNDEDKLEIEKQVNSMIPSMLFDICRGKKIRACIACDFIEVSVPLIKEALN